MAFMPGQEHSILLKPLQIPPQAHNKAEITTVKDCMGQLAADVSTLREDRQPSDILPPAAGPILQLLKVMFSRFRTQDISNCSYPCWATTATGEP